MNKLVYKNFVWPQNPERYQQDYVREPIYARNEAGQTVFSGMGPMKRTITGSGAFFGDTAYADFLALAKVFEDGTYGGLIHPVFGTYRCYFTELRLVQEPRKDYVAYQFEFREADEQGNIPQ